MSTTVLPQLKTVSSELEAEAASIEQQLSLVREKRKAILSVIEIFDASPATESDDDSTAKETSAPIENAKEATEAKNTAKAKKPKKDGRASNWRKYMLGDYKSFSMPDAVQQVLEQQPKKDFRIAEVMSALFKEDMPKSQYLKARNRVSNILSAGARSGDWYKGDRSSYRFAK